MTPKRRSRRLRPLEMNKEKKVKTRLNLITESKMFHGNTMFIGNTQKESRYLCSPVSIAVASGGYNTDFSLYNIVTLCLLFLR